MEQYQQALRLQPDYALAHNNLGHALLALGKPDDAEHHFREAVRLDPRNADAHYNLGMIARARGDASERSSASGKPSGCNRTGCRR